MKHLIIRKTDFTLLIITISFLSLVNYAFSQTPIHHIYDFEKGLPSSEAYDCFQDEENNIWIATDNGVSKFNSREFKNYTVSDGLPGPVVFKIFEDQNKTLWFTGHNRSICYYDRKTDRFVPYKYNEVLAKTHSFDFINKLSFIGNDQEIDIQTNHGHYNVNSSGKLIDKSVFTEDFVFVIDSTQNINHGNLDNTLEKTVRLSIQGQLDTVIHVESKMVIPNRGFTGSYQVSKNETLLYFKNILIHLKDKKISIRKTPDVICSITMWKDEIHCGIYSHGILVLDTETLETKKQYFQGHTISGLLVDGENSLWATSTELGLIYLPRSYFEGFKTSLVSKNIVESAQINDRIFFTTKSGQLYEFDVKTKSTHHLSKWDNGRLVAPKLLIQDNKIHLISSNNKGIAYNLSTNKLIEEPYPEGQIKLNDSLFLRGTTNGVFVKDQNGNGLHDSILAGNYVSKMFEIAEKQILVSVKPGLLLLDARKIDDIKLTTIKEDIDPTSFSWYKNAIIITTKTSGVWVYENGSIRLLSKQLPPVRYSGSNSKGDLLYFSSSNGLYIYNPRTDKVVHYGRYHGLADIDLLNVLIGEDNNAWLVSRSSFYKFDLTEETSTFKPSISISRIICDADTITDHIFHHDHKVIEFQLESICYKCLEDVTYKYRVLGLSDKWLTTHQSFIRLNSLPAGDYSIEVIAITPGGEESDIYNYSFSIPLPFWKTWHFNLLIALVVLSAIVIVMRLRRKAEKRKILLQEKLTYNRQLALRKYLNPHFIFNSLNSIQSYVVQGNKEEAQVFISQFSKLMREYLDAGVNEEVSIKKELEILDRYVELEETRLGRELTFTYKISKDIDVETTMIPSFIIQPIIENSIWHGISKKENCGMISVSFKKDGKVLSVNIVDDGMGQIAPNQIDKQSKSMSINQERLELLSTLHKEKFEMQAGNLYNGNNEIIGFEVDVKLPFVLKQSLK